MRGNESIHAAKIVMETFALRTVLVFSLCLFLSCICLAQKKDTSINRKRLNTVVLGTSAAYTGSMIALSEIWYSKNDKQSFHFFNDASEWKQVDKAGHFYSAFQLSAIGSRLLQWSTVNKRKSDKAGAIASFFMMSSIEVFDGFSSGYGASASDLLANALGSSFYLSQNLTWNETRIYPKFSFHRSDFAALRPTILGTSLGEELIKDYNGQTYWLSVDMDKFLRFPKWLNLSAGYGAHGMVYANDEQNLANGFKSNRQYYVGLDFDLTAYRSKSKVLNTLILFANMIKLPAPSVEFSNGKVKGHLFSF